MEKKTPSVVIFVHGFGSSAMAWAGLKALLDRDADVKDLFEFRCFEYPTKAISFNPFQSIPSIQNIAKLLARYIETAGFTEREIMLVGHSQGGLVIQGYLYSVLTSGQGEKLDSIRQVILFATPNLGSTFISGLRRFVSIFTSNLQERSLRVLDPQMAEIRRRVNEQIVNAKQATSTTWPIPFRIFYGLQDGIVSPDSAKGSFQDENAVGVTADHFTIIAPRSTDDPLYREIVSAIKTPVGHVNVYELDWYKTKITVEPGSGEPVEWKGVSPRSVPGRHVGHVDRAVKVARENRRADTFGIRYRTTAGGFIKFRTSHKNEASSEEQGRHDSGTEVMFRFTPRQGQEYYLNVDVFGGFEKGNRTIHFHIGRDSYCKRRIYELDLSGYVSAGYKLEEPTLYFHHNDLGHSELCERRDKGREVKPSTVGQEGKWRWDLFSIRQGVVDIVWDVSETVGN